MATEEELQQAWINTRLAVLQAIDAQVGNGKASPDNASQALDLAEAYAWLTRPDQPHGKGA
jgi:glycyl-tRNA synthetase alpha subunit